MLVTFLAALAAALYAGKAAVATEKANALHERTAHSSERAWLEVAPDVRTGIDFDAKGKATLKVRFIVQNIGRSPAYAVSSHADIYLFATNWPSPQDAQVSFAENILLNHNNKIGSIIFPGSTLDQTHSLQMLPHNIRGARQKMLAVDGDDTGTLYPCIIGCVQYLTKPDGGRPSQTGFIYAIRGPRVDGKRAWITDKESVRRADVKLETYRLAPKAVT